ncbi:DNA adenine methylase [Micromonospora aurantiaca (nom. illeg.)]|uniref:DNA adenine methylase n=1 Tax=Micromonospora aurantiaca (nom. illeg.) TaxID=47850 RepID=UPI003788EF98
MNAAAPPPVDGTSIPHADDQSPPAPPFMFPALRSTVPPGNLSASLDPPPEVEPDAEAQRPKSLVPFLKWPGGKRWLVALYPHLIPATFNRYIEPFLGGGSVYFHLQPTVATLGDANLDVVRAFRGIKLAPHRVKELLQQYHAQHCADHYYLVREARPKSLAEHAARTIYLNRTCFNGIYRVNRAGKFNVPIGTRSNVMLDTDDFITASRLLRTADIRHSDFEQVIDLAHEGDLIFADPPYTVRHNTNGFVLYNETLFSWADQQRLANALHRAKNRGVQVLSTNAAHESVRELYNQKGFKLETISRFSPIAARSKSRKQFEELVITA